MCQIEVGEARGIVVRALGWDKPRMIQRGTSRVFGVNFGRCQDHYQWRPGEVRCHDFHRFSSFSTLSPRRSHSFHSTMTYFYPLSYLILSSFSLSYLLRSYGQDGETRLVETSPGFSISQFLPRASRASAVSSSRRRGEGLLNPIGDPKSIGPPTPPSLSSLVKSTIGTGATADT